MPEAGWNAAKLLQRADPSVEAREAQRLPTEGFGAELSLDPLDRRSFFLSPPAVVP